MDVCSLSKEWETNEDCCLDKNGPSLDRGNRGVLSNSRLHVCMLKLLLRFLHNSQPENYATLMLCFAFLTCSQSFANKKDIKLYLPDFCRDF